MDLGLPPPPAAEYRQVAAVAPLRFDIKEGLNHNLFVQSPQQTSHVVVTMKKRPRVLFTFPAGNSGIGVWGETASLQAQGVDLGADGTVRLRLRVPDGRWRITRLMLDSIRAIRDVGSPAEASTDRLRDRFAAQLKAPAHWASPALIVQPNGFDAMRQELDGRRYLLRVRVKNGTVQGTPKVLDGGRLDQPLVLRARKGPLELTLEASIPFDALQPYAGLEQLVRPEILALANSQPRVAESLKHLQLLTYREKLLAGAWRFETYFGRDTMLTLLMLRPALQDEVMRNGLVSVLDRLSPEGIVAHEEDIGSWAEVRHLQALAAGGDKPKSWHQPVYDYKMIDGDFFLPILAAAVADTPGGEAALRSILATTGPDGQTRGQALSRNLRRVLQLARQDIITIHKGEKVGDWRDSEAGLGFGTAPSSVNVDMVAAALRATQRLAALGLWDPQEVADMVQQRLPHWDGITRRFDVTLDAPAIRQSVRHFMQSLTPESRLAFAAQVVGNGVTLQQFLDGREVPGLQRIRFAALSLKPDGTPVRVATSDGGFRLLLGNPSREDVRDIVQVASLPFPIGLMTPVGMVVANPAYADDAVIKALHRDAYHGTVMWSWQHNLMALGLMRQLERFKHDAELSGAIRTLLDQLGTAEQAARKLAHSELWTYEVEGGKIVPLAFGERDQSEDESNAVQLWSATWPAVAWRRLQLGVPLKP